jgi:sec-independent protein translocase protein TatA
VGVLVAARGVGVGVPRATTDAAGDGWRAAADGRAITFGTALGLTSTGTLVACARSMTERTIAGPAVTPVIAVATAIVAPSEAMPMGPLKNATRKSGDIEQDYLSLSSTCPDACCSSMTVMPFGPWELIVILLIVAVIFGAGRLSEVGGAVGKSIREFRKATTDDASGHTPTAAPPIAADAPTAPLGGSGVVANMAVENKCPSCATVNPTGQAFCGQCGTRLTRAA